MYGVLFSAVAVAAASLALLKRLGARTVSGAPVAMPPKTLGRGHRYWMGGSLSGAGWALTGACPGPLFALAGGGPTVYVVAVGSAVAGAWIYAWLRPHLPHY